MKKWMAVVLVAAMMVSSVTGIGCPKAAAAEYSTASQFVMNGQWSSDYWITDTDTEHWYKLFVPSDGKVTIKLMSYMRWVYYRLYNEDLSTTIGSANPGGGTDTAPKTETYEYILSAGTYFIKIYQDGSSSGKYKLNAGYEQYGVTDMGADSYDSPLALPMGATVVGAITETDREDWYRFNVPSSGNYAVTVTSYMSSLDYKVYNSDLSVKILDKSLSGTETAPKTEHSDCTLSAGIYYIKIDDDDWWDETGKYMISWSQLTQNNCSHDYQTSYISSTYTRTGYTLHQCSKCGHSYRDNYVPKRTLAQMTLWGTSKKGKAEVSWSYVSDASGYQLRYSTNRSFRKSVKTLKIKGKNKTKRTIKRLKRKKKYYFQIRAYKKVGKTTIYGKWSPTKVGKIL